MSLFFFLAAAASAVDPVSAADPVAASSDPVVDTGAFGAATPLNDAVLARETARADVAQIAQANQAAGVSRNSINGDSVTGTVTFDGAAFQGLQGLSIVNANSGNNVAVNAAMNVNITLTPAVGP